MVVLIGAAAALALIVVLYLRFAPSDPARWHVDPVSTAAPGRPNAWLVAPAGAPRAQGAHATSPVFPADPRELAFELDRIAMAEPRAERLAGGPDGLWTTYIHRTRRLRFPDYTSVRVLPAPGGATVAIYARARFGHADLGVNRARVEKWLAALPPVQQDPRQATR